MALSTNKETSDSVPTPPKNEAIIDESESPPRDRGVWAWVQCVAGFCLFFNTWGMLNSFGIFQTFYEQDFLRNSSASQVSWIGTVQSSFIMLGSLYSGPLFDRGYLRHLVLLGSIILVFGMFMTSICTQYWHILLTQGVVMGLGTGCLFTPTTGVIASHFDKRRGLAMGIVSTGSTIGGIIFPVMFHKLVDSAGYGWTIRAIAFLMLALSILPVCSMRVRVKTPSSGNGLDIGAFRDPGFSFFAIAMFVGYLGLYIPFFYIQLYSLEERSIVGGLNVYTLPIMNAAGLLGRLALGYLGDRIGPLNAFMLSAWACGALVFAWSGMETKDSVIAFCVLYGFFSSGLITLPATVVAQNLCPDIRQYGVRMMLHLVPAALGLLIGNPIAGAILKDGWTGLQVFAASLIVASAIFSGLTKYFTVRLSKNIQG
ncbi:putative MFS monocarboxylate transporter [Bimuria novae-zelandiae CBS 107.79]|uniref:Putative MFS monocarboxylate transporter n=1 Tax=Bimuria novae-zelandiae CBS 107.79 TaxID=1447943 RepID=A0A6A5V8D3_9PLEO|nr:putative MFS monocarboxylate transporter [Bimuria novae-zelandiae CBS 107.79]